MLIELLDRNMQIEIVGIFGTYPELELHMTNKIHSFIENVFPSRAIRLRLCFLRRIADCA